MVADCSVLYAIGYHEMASSGLVLSPLVGNVVRYYIVFYYIDTMGWYGNLQ